MSMASRCWAGLLCCVTLQIERRYQAGQAAAASSAVHCRSQPPHFQLLAWVPLMMTVWAGRLTPQARVAVDTSTCSQRLVGGRHCNERSLEVASGSSP